MNAIHAQSLLDAIPYAFHEVHNNVLLYEAMLELTRMVEGVDPEPQEGTLTDTIILTFEVARTHTMLGAGLITEISGLNYTTILDTLQGERNSTNNPFLGVSVVVQPKAMARWLQEGATIVLAPHDPEVIKLVSVVRSIVL